MRAIKLFLSYRRDDNPYAAGRLYDHLINDFGEDAVYFDVTASYGGIDFRKLIDYKIAECEAVIVVIGEKWLSIKDEEGNRRIDQADDFVHIEVRSALDRGIPITPIFVDNGKIPKPSDLPEILKDLSYRNGFPASASEFRIQVKGIINAIRNGIVLHREISEASQSQKRQAEVVEEAPAEVIEAINATKMVKPVIKAGGEIDVYVSYSHIDNEPLVPGQQGWVTNFCKALQKVLSMRIGREANIWFDETSLEPNANIDGALYNILDSTATVVALISPRYLNSELCIRELDLFEPTISDGASNLFTVFKYPVEDRGKIPANARDMLGYMFFTTDQGIPIELSPDSREFYNKIHNLVSDIARQIGGK